MPNSTHGIPERRVITQTVTDDSVQKDVAHGPCILLSVDYLNDETGTVDHFIHIYDDLDPTMGASGTAEDVKLLARDKTSNDGKSKFLINPNNGGLPITKGLSFGVSTDTAGDNAPADGSSKLTFVVTIP